MTQENDVPDNLENVENRMGNPCPACGVVIPAEAEIVSGSDGYEVTRCPGCQEEYPTDFRREEFATAVTERLRTAGAGDLSEHLAAGGIAPDPVSQNRGLPVAAKADLTPGAPERKLAPGNAVAPSMGPEMQMARGGLTPVDGPPAVTGKPDMGGEKLMVSSSPEAPKGPASPVGVPAGEPVTTLHGDEDGPGVKKNARPPSQN